MRRAGLRPRQGGRWTRTSRRTRRLTERGRVPQRAGVIGGHGVVPLIIGGPGPSAVRAPRCVVRQAGIVPVMSLSPVVATKRGPGRAPTVHIARRAPWLGGAFSL